MKDRRIESQAAEIEWARNADRAELMATISEPMVGAQRKAAAQDELVRRDQAPVLEAARSSAQAARVSAIAAIISLVVAIAALASAAWH